MGSTRVKSVLIDFDGKILASGSHTWENKLDENNYWTYSEDDIWESIRNSYGKLKEDVKDKYQVTLSGTSAFGISAMMHGYLAFNDKGEMLVPFRTWRNNYTSEAAKQLRDTFEFNIPERWSVAHYYQAILNKEEHIKDVRFLTTLAGYVHWKLTGEKVLGIDDASGMFPIDIYEKNYDQDMIEKFNDLVKDENCSNIDELLPRILLAGEYAGRLTKEGAKLLDIEGDLKEGAIFAPPEGDAGTGMVATNCIEKNTANVSAGTSAFAMIVLDKSLKSYYPEIDIVTTPSGNEVAMVHTNNCTSEINAWVNLFDDLLKIFDIKVNNDELYSKLFLASKNSDEDIGDLFIYGFHSGENILNVKKGLPMLVRKTNNRFNISNVMKANIITAFAPLHMGLKILHDNEDIEIKKTLGHGGIFNTPIIAQEILASIMDSPVTTLDTANEGGAWGMALLALYTLDDKGVSLEEFLNEYIFKYIESTTISSSEKIDKEVENYLKNYRKGMFLAKDAGLIMEDEE